jgi:glycosyltransferase involved in cell wall biosynthesis
VRIACLALIEIDVANACLVHTREIAEGLAALGHEVTLILPRPLRMQAWHGVRHVWVRWWGFDRLRQWAFFVESAWHLWRLHRRRRFDLLYAREMARPPFLSGLVRLLRLPLFIEVNGWVLDDLRLLGAPRRELRAAERSQRNLFTAAIGILASTVGNAEKIVVEYGIPRQRVHVQELGTNTGHFTPGDRQRVRTDLGLPLNGEIILFAGSFHPHHDLSTLVSAFDQLVAQGFEKVRLVLVGDGQQWQSIRQLVDSSGITERVITVHSRPYETIASYFQAADIGVLPLTAAKITQQHGALASKLWDYMAAGLPVVVTDFSHTPSASLLADKAYLVPPEDPNAMAAAFLDLLRDMDKRTRLAEAGLQYVRQHRTWRQAAAETADFIVKRLNGAI